MEPSARNKHEKCETFYVHVHYCLGTVGSASSQAAWLGTGGLTVCDTYLHSKPYDSLCHRLMYI